MHDALHGSVSSNFILNETVGRISLAAFIPAAPMEIARWIHLKHHAHTTADIDPDNFMHHGHWFVLPFRWANFDFYYLKALVSKPYRNPQAPEKPILSIFPIILIFHNDLLLLITQTISLA